MNLIVHGHVRIGEQRMTVPGYHVLKEEEDSLNYNPSSPFADPEHSFRKELESRRFTSEEEEEATEGEEPDDEEQEVE